MKEGGELGVGKLGLQTGSAIPAGRMPQMVEPPSPGRADVSKSEAGLKLWKEWAAESLGALAAGPTATEEMRSKMHIARLEKKCKTLAACAQRRLAISSMLRNGTLPANTPGGAPLSPESGQRSQRGTDGVARQGKEAMWAAQERRRSVAYTAARALGEAQRLAGEASAMPVLGSHAASHNGSQSGALPTTQLPARQTGVEGAYAGGSIPSPGLKSHTMLNTLMASRVPGLLAGMPGTQAAGGTPGKEYVTHLYSPSHSLSPAASGTWQGQGSGRRQARSHSVAGSPQDLPTNGRPSPSRRRGRGAQSIDAGMLEAVMHERDELAARLQETQDRVEAKEEIESQLREALDVLRARVAAQGARELDAQRRLQMHARLEPIFDKLAESFMFRSAEEVVERLQFLEDDRLASFDELLRAQEDVASLQNQLNAALERVEVTRTQVTSQQLEAAGRLQARNQQLQADLEQLQSLNRKLESRQAQLVSLQGAVIDLWNCCERDAAFAAANVERDTVLQGRASETSASKESGPGSVAGAAQDPNDPDQPTGGGGSSMGDLEGMLSLIKELLVAKTSAPAARYYHGMQQVAHRVWAAHFKHKPKLRGRVLETFEALSGLAQIMATRIRSITDQLARSRAMQTELVQDLEQSQLQKRALQVALERRDALVRDMIGIPRAQRPGSLSAYQKVAAEDTWRLRAGRRASSASASTSRNSTPLGHASLLNRLQSGRMSVKASKAQQLPARPTSAAQPQTSHTSVPSPGASAFGILASAQVPHISPVAQRGVPARPASAPGARHGSQGGRPHSAGPHWAIDDHPGGPHWAGYRAPGTPRGALFHSKDSPITQPAPARHADGPQDSEGPGPEVADAARAPDQAPTPPAAAAPATARQWIPPTRQGIEAAFLSRLQRAGNY